MAEDNLRHETGDRSPGRVTRIGKGIGKPSYSRWDGRSRDTKNTKDFGGWERDVQRETANNMRCCRLELFLEVESKSRSIVELLGGRL